MCIYLTKTYTAQFSFFSIFTNRLRHNQFNIRSALHYVLHDSCYAIHIAVMSYRSVATTEDTPSTEYHHWNAIVGVPSSEHYKWSAVAEKHTEGWLLC